MAKDQTLAEASTGSAIRKTRQQKSSVLSIRTHPRNKTKQESVSSVSISSALSPTKQENSVIKWLAYIVRARRRHRRRMHQHTHFLHKLEEDKDVIRKFLSSSEPNRPVVRWLKKIQDEKKHFLRSMEKEDQFLGLVGDDLSGILAVRKTRLSGKNTYQDTVARI